MFTFFKKKKKSVDTQNIKDFKDAINAINIFMLLSEWKKAKTSLIEVRVKEKESFDQLIQQISEEIDTIKAENEKEKQITLFKKRNSILDKLEYNIGIKEEKYLKKASIERFKFRFKKIKEEIEALTGNKQNPQALNLLQNFLEENKENPSVVQFFNKEKKIIIRNIEKVKKIEQEKIKKNARLEALNLIGQNVNLGFDPNEENKNNSEKSPSLLMNIKSKLNFYKNIKERKRKKLLLDEINMLIEEDSRVKDDIAAKKLANIHKGLIKELSNDNIVGYELYGKILGADKISGDTFGFYEGKKKYNFFLGDATGHGIRAGFIITLLSRLFTKHVEKSNIQELTYQINNGLKQDLKSRNFITGIFFEIEKEDNDKINFVGMGHEPMFIYRKKDHLVEKVIPGGLAAGIRIINKQDDIKVKEIMLNDGDILLTYSDGIVENKSPEGEFFGMVRLEKIFKEIASQNTEITVIYENLIKEIQIFRGGSQFDDDTSVLIVKRDVNKDIVDENSKYIQDISIKEGLKRNEIKSLQGKTKEQIEKELENIRKKKETKRVIKILEGLYYTGEILKLKQEAIRFIKNGFIDKKINYYLKKAIDNEKRYKIDQKNQKIANKYNVLQELYKKGDYNTVIQEIEEIISKDGSI